MQADFNSYRKYGFRPFSLPAGEKRPHSGTSLGNAERIAYNSNMNIGLFTGSKNMLAVIDADSKQAEKYITTKLEGMGLLDWLTIVRTPTKGGLHFWVRLECPGWVKAFYRLSPDVGLGELRLQFPAYVVAPPSKVASGQYTFVQGGLEQFCNQPVLGFFEIATWLVKPDALVERTDKLGDPLPLPQGIFYNPNPRVLELFSYLSVAIPGQPIPKIDYRTGMVLEKTFRSRSEAEAAVFSGLVLAGWSFDQVKDRFIIENPGHYRDQPNQEKYLLTSYNNAVRYVTRLKASDGQRVMPSGVLAPNHP